MRKLWLSLVLLAALPLLATDHAISCGDSTTLNSTIASLPAGDRAVLQSSSGGVQCVYTVSSWALSKLSYSHPTAEAVLSTTVSGGAVTSCAVASGGSAYTITPLVSVVGGRGEGATIHVTISGGAVNGCVVDSGGNNYTKPPTAVVYSPELYRYVVPDNLASLPPVGRRLNPSAQILPKVIFTTTTLPIDVTAGSGLYDGSAYWYFEGIEMTMNSPVTISLFANLKTTSHFVFEHDYIYPQPCPNSTPPYNTNGRITFGAGGYDLQFRDNYLPCWYGLPPGGVVGQGPTDSMNVIADSYGEAIVIDNNLLTGWFNPFFFGGGDPPASAAGSSTISSRTAGSATLAAPPAAVSLIALQLPFEGNTIPISSISRNANVVTVVTSGAHGFLTGAYVYPKGVTDTSFNATYDGNGAANCGVRNDTGCRQITVVNSTTFTYSQTAANATSSGGVIVPTTCQAGPAYGCFLDANVSSIAGNTVNYTHGWVSAFAWGTFDVLATVPNLLVQSGGAAQWDGPQVTNSDVTRNYIQHNTAFDTWVATNNGNVSKGCPGEVKFWNGGTMKGNYCGGFPVSSVGFNGNSSRGSAPWVKISDVRVESNVFDRFIGLFFGNYEYEPLATGDHMLVTNNLWAHGDNNNVSTAQANEFGPNNITNYNNFTFSHNTILTGLPYTAYPCIVGSTSPNGDCRTTKFFAMAAHTEQPLQILGYPSVIFKDNIAGVGAYGVQCGSGGGLTVVGNCWNSLTESNNILVSNADGQCVLGSTCDWTTNQFPFTNSTGATGGQPLWQGVNGTFPHAMFIKWADVGMTNPNNSQFTLLSTSPGFHGASDGTDVGANYVAINAALGPDNPQLTTGSTTNIVVSPSTAAIPKSGTQQFTSSVTGSTWTVNGACAGSVSSAGVFTATSAVETCTVTSTLSASSGSATVNVQGLTVTPPSVGLLVGGTQQFTVNFTSTWSATCGTISGSGLYTAPSTNGTCTITATAVNGGTTATGTATVSGAQTFIPLTVTPTSWNFGTVTSGSSTTKAFAVSNIGTGSVTPTLALTGSAAYTISANTCTGAIAGGGNCSVTIQFHPVAGGSYAGNLQITDTAGGNKNIPLSGNVAGTIVSITPKLVTLPKLGVQQFTATATNSSGVTYAASIGSIGSTTGQFTAPNSATTGTVTATATDSSGATDSANVTVQALTVSPSTAAMQVSGTQQFVANFTSTWGASCGTISGSGLYTAPVTNGTCTITATAVNGGTTATATVTVTGQQTFIPLVTSPTSWNYGTVAIATPVNKAFSIQNVGTGTVTISTQSITAGTTQFSINTNTCGGTLAGGATCTFNVAFSSSAAGSFSGNLRVQDSAGGLTNAPLIAQVNPSTVVTVSPTSATLPKLGTQQFTANVGVTWTATIGSISSAGIYTAPNSATTGTVRAVATDGSGSNATAAVTILDVLVSPVAVTLRVGAIQQFTSNFPATWSASCGTITSFGVYTAPSTATSCVVTATATNGGSTGTSAISVVPAPGNSAGKAGGKGKGSTGH
jgi:hypothetical protein